jgi:hypothetical protein
VMGANDASFNVQFDRTLCGVCPNLSCDLSLGGVLIFEARAYDQGVRLGSSPLSSALFLAGNTDNKGFANCAICFLCRL